MLGSISDLNTAILHINEMLLWFQFFIMALHNEPIKSLGVHFGYNKTQCDQLNYEKQINKCKAIIKNWNQRSILFFNNLNIHVICKAFILVSMLVIFNPPSK
jgi:hypothetical protein